MKVIPVLAMILMNGTAQAAYVVNISGTAELLPGSVYDDYSEIIKKYGTSLEYSTSFVLDRAVYHPEVDDYFINYSGYTSNVTVNGNRIELIDERPYTSLYVASFKGDPWVSAFLTNVTPWETADNQGDYVGAVIQFAPQKIEGGLIPDLMLAAPRQPFHFVYVTDSKGSARYNFSLTGFSIQGDQPFVETYVAPPPAAPEPASWALMIVGFGAVGAGLRREGSRNRLVGKRSLLAHLPRNLRS